MEMNWAQQQAVQHKDGPMLVLAGPGSGKTFVITERTRYLIEEYKIPEKHILVITFTKAAANEMKDRFLKRMKVNYTAVSYGTFHAIFFTILKYAYHLNASNIVREEVRNQFLRETIQRLDLEYEDEKEFISDIASEISLVKGEQIDLANYYSSHCASDVFKKIYQEYDKKLRRANLIDFDDMLVLCYQLLSERKDILALWQNKFQYILIDEFQDINRIQYEIVKMLAAPHNNLFIVGDDDQSIYRFRGAKPEIMLKFPKDYPDGKRILLDKNYRSQANIVAASSKLIKNNEQRYDKAVNAVRASGSSIVIKNFETLTQENKTLAEEIIKLNKKGIALNNMAILIRTNMGSEALLHKLMEYNIPFRMKDNLPNIFDHWIARDIISYITICKP
jgi:DNA helicase-2/ATP-dependent DNA helicase PcrA